jgi:alpha-L-rhamnosidase
MCASKDVLVIKKIKLLKHLKNLSFFWLTLLALTGCSQENEQRNKNEPKQVQDQLASPVQLKVGEGFVNPLGYYEQRPRFSWKLPNHGKAQLQSAYQVQVANTSNFHDKQIIWDSKKVGTKDNAWIEYGGPKLQSRQKVFWRVKMWDENDRVSKWSEVNHLELGLIENDDWKAQWIGHPETGERNQSEVKEGRFSAPDNLYYRPQYLRTTFEVNKKVAKARLYITSKGVFKPFINGEQVSQDVMTPGWTPYHKRIETLTYDVTTQIKQGANALSAVVAEGWHTGRIFHPTKKEYILPMRLLAQLEVTYNDGSVKVITSNDSWQSTIDGPIREASNYDGETYDARYEMPGWNTAQYNAATWQPVVVEPIDNQVKLKPKRHQPVRVTKSIPAIDIVSVKEGVAIFDMGQNMVGVPKIAVPGIAGEKIKLRFAEALEKDFFHVKNLRSAKNTDYYTPKEDGVIEYQPTFTFHGYRYVELTGYDESQTPKLEWIKGQVLHSDFEVFDNFESSHGKLNKLSENVEWGLRGNFLDIPTDCPQRDERLGWTGDAQVFAMTSMYKADVYSFWAAWLESVREEQSIDGMVPKFVPFRAFLTDGTAAAWGDVATILPWDLYQFTGDKKILADNYNMMKRWLSYHEFHSYEYSSYLGTYGDWLQPYSKGGRAKGDTHPDIISSAYFARSADITSKTARLLGYESDAQQYETLFKNLKEKFRTHYFDENLDLKPEVIKVIQRESGKRLRQPKQIVTNPVTTQTTYLMPLAFNMFEANDEKVAVAKLLKLLEQSDHHLRTGFLGTPMLAPVLQKFGHSEVMYDILFKETYPSWFYSINNGATTTWERWNSYSLEDGFNKANMNSLNHYAYGAVASWFYRGMLGVEQTQPGFKHFKVEPQFTTKLSEVSGSHPTPQGEIAVSWSVKEQQLSMSLTVPKNTEASLVLPNIKNISIIRDNSISVQSPDLLPPGNYEIKGNFN